MVRVPQIEDIGFAIKLYYSKPQIGNKDIAELFPNIQVGTQYAV